MRKFSFILAILLFLAASNLSYAQELNIRFINLKEVLDNYQKVKDGEEVLFKEAEQKNDAREKLVKEIKSLREKIDLLTDKQKERKQAELDQKVKQLQDFTYQTRSELREKRDEKFREIMKELKEVIEEYGQSHNYSLIIDDTLLLYKDKNLDVTEEITKLLNQRYKK